jgi:hypothetical protein
MVALAALGTACSKKTNPNEPSNNSMSRPVSPPTPGSIIARVNSNRSVSPARKQLGRVIAFLAGPIGGITTYGFFVVVIAGAVFGFMEVLERDDKNGTSRK